MIEIDTSVCSGCRRCEVQCAFFHTNTVGRSASRIHVVKIESLGFDGPVMCRQCRERYCMECPVDAMSIGSFNEIRIDPEVCIGCGVCANLCPIGAIEIIKKTAQVCDLCGGEPRCVSACGPGALKWNSDIKDIPLSEETEGGYIQADNKVSPGEKRLGFICSHKSSVIPESTGC